MKHLTTVLSSAKWLFTTLPGVFVLILVLGGTAAATAPVFNGQICFTGSGAASYCSKAPIAVSQAVPSPSGVQPNTFNAIVGLGDNSTFRGVSGGYFTAVDASNVTSGTKGVLYGLQVDVGPALTRNNTPYDDADDLVLDNSGAGRGTESVYFAHNANLSSGDFGAALGLDMWATDGIYMDGHYTYGITFVHGASSVFNSGGGPILVPTPAPSASPIPIISVGGDAVTPSNNTAFLSEDVAKTAIFGTLVNPLSGIEHLALGSNASETANSVSRIGTNESLHVYNGSQDHIVLDDGTDKWGISMDGSHNFRLAEIVGSTNILLNATTQVTGSISATLHNACSSSSGIPCETTVTCAISAGTTCTANAIVPTASNCTATYNVNDSETGPKWISMGALSTNTQPVIFAVNASQTTTAAANVTCL